ARPRPCRVSLARRPAHPEPDRLQVQPSVVWSELPDGVLARLRTLRVLLFLRLRDSLSFGPFLPFFLSAQGGSRIDPYWCLGWDSNPQEPDFEAGMFANFITQTVSTNRHTYC